MIFCLSLEELNVCLKYLLKCFPRLLFLLCFMTRKKVGHIFPKERVRTSFLQSYPSFIRKRYRLLTHKIPRAIEEMNFEGFDFVISSSGAYSHGIITPLETKHICYCHSPMRYAWDYSNEYREENDIKGFKAFLYAPLMKYLREWDAIAADRPTRYLSNSRHVQKRISKYYKMESDIVYPPVDTEKISR